MDWIRILYRQTDSQMDGQDDSYIPPNCVGITILMPHSMHLYISKPSLLNQTSLTEYLMSSGSMAVIDLWSKDCCQVSAVLGISQ